MQKAESLNESFQRPIVEEFELPSGLKARRFKFSARDAMAVQREFVSRSAQSKDFEEENFQLLIICKCVQLQNDKGEWNHIVFEDIDEVINGYDYITLFGKIAALTNREGTGVNPK